MLENQELANLKRKVEELERTLKLHNHYGFDKSQIIDGDIKIKSNRIIQLGKGYLANANLNEGLSSEVNRLLLACGLDDTRALEYKTDNVNLILEHQQNSALSFFYGFRPPLYVGPRPGDTINIISGGNTIADPKQTFTTNELVGAYISVVGKTPPNTLETHLIASNTVTQITIATTWGFSESVSYLAFVPVYLGAAGYPWKRLYIIGDIRFGRGSSGGTKVGFLRMIEANGRLYWKGTDGVEGEIHYTGSPSPFHIRAGTPGNAADFKGYMYYDTDRTDLVFSNGVGWYKIEATAY